MKVIINKCKTIYINEYITYIQSGVFWADHCDSNWDPRVKINFSIWTFVQYLVAVENKQTIVMLKITWKE